MGALLESVASCSARSLIEEGDQVDGKTGVALGWGEWNLGEREIRRKISSPSIWWNAGSVLALSCVQDKAFMFCATDARALAGFRLL